MTHPLPPCSAASFSANGRTRRDILTACAALPLAMHLPALANDAAPLKIAQSAAMSGPLGDLGQALHQGAKAYFTALNATGGVLGRPIELTVVDDGYNTARAVANVNTFMEDRSNFAIFNCFGTAMVEAMLGPVTQAGIPFFAPYTGAASVRPQNVPNLFNLRASYADETEQLVQHLATIGMQRIAIVHQNNAFGKDVLQAAQRAMAKHALKATLVITVQDDASNAAEAATSIAAVQPEAVLMGLAGAPTVAFVKAIRAHRKGLPLYALSVMGSAATLKAMGPDATGITVSQVVPMPTQPNVQIAREFLQHWKASGTALEPSHVGLEGYINARVFAEIVRRAGRNLTRASFIESAWAMKRFNLGGFEVSFTQSGQNASRLVDLTMVARDGRFLR